MDENKKLKIRNRHIKRKNGKKVARTVKQRLVWLISFLAVIALTLIFRVGEAIWPGWMIEYRTAILGLVLFALLSLISLSPIIVEVEQNPRPLSGPGKDPRQVWGP